MRRMARRDLETMRQWHSRALHNFHKASEAVELLSHRRARIGAALAGSVLGPLDEPMLAATAELNAAREDLLAAVDEIRRGTADGF